MFGKNPIRSSAKGDGSSLDIQSIFLTLQGEGPYSGHPSIFIRLGGCNLACKFCDTEFESFKTLTLDNIISEVISAIGESKVKLAVITGGEPFRQPLKLLCYELIKLGLKIQIETNGTLFQELPDEVEIVCSPKTSNGKYHEIRADLKKKISYYKFLISSFDEGYNYLPKWDFLGKTVYIQPMDNYDTKINSQNMIFAVELSLKTGYILSLQTHKILGIQ